MLNRAHCLLIVIFSIVTIVVSLTMVQGQTTKEANNSQSIDDKEKDYFSKLRDTFFVVEYSNQSVLDHSRKLKSKKYDYINMLNPETTQDYQEASSLHWETGLTALPIEKSQIIVIGRLVDAQAHLSSQKKMFTLSLR